MMGMSGYGFGVLCFYACDIRMGKAREHGVFADWKMDWKTGPGGEGCFL
jgi:hypothetical protein